MIHLHKPVLLQPSDQLYENIFTDETRENNAPGQSQPWSDLHRLKARAV